MTLRPGERLGPYEIAAQVGVGGMGEVYRARDSKLKPTVAIKILPREFAQNPDRVERFQHEAEALAALNHPNIGAIHAIEEANDTRFLVLEFVEGVTLAQRVRRGSLPPAEVVSIAIQICSALAAAHDRAVVHRDLKPANIKITPDGQVKLLDFGLARMMAPDASPPDLSQSPTVAATTADAVIAGTAAYMAPEQARGKPVDRRADLWALGCVLYEMLTGTPAFAGETVTDILAAVVTQQPTLDRLPANTPAALRWVIGRCLQKDPAARFRDAADAAAVLNAGLEPAPLRARAPRLRSAAVVAGGIAVAGATAVGIRYFTPAPPRAALTRFDIPVTAAPITQAMALSPDGRRVVYVVSPERGRFALWLRSLDALDARMIEGTEATRTFMAPAWSPDGRAIAFIADGKLKTIGIGGGAAETLATVDSQVGGIAWNREGVILFASNDHGLRRVAASGGPVTDVSERDASLDETYHDCPVFLPDGRHFLYLGYSEPKPDNRAVYIGSLDSKARTRLMASDACAAYAEPGFVVFPRGRALFARPFDARGLTFTGDASPLVDDVATYANGEFAAFAVSDGGTLVYRKSAPQSEAARSLVWITRSGGVGDPIGAPLQSLTNPAIRLSPDDKRVAFSSAAEGAREDIWTHDLERNIRLRLTRDPGIDHVPLWSSDGSRVIFDSHRRGQGSALYEIPSDGAVSERPLLEIEGTDFIATGDWSRDGRHLVFHRSATANPPWSLWVLPLFGDRKPFLYKSSPADYWVARLSPDGRWLAFTTNESGTYQIVVQTFPDPSRGKWQVSSSGGTAPAWRRDGRELYYLAASGDLVAVSVTADARFVVGKSTTLFRAPVQRGTQNSQYDAAADGQRFLFSVPAANTTPRSRRS